MISWDLQQVGILAKPNPVSTIVFGGNDKQAYRKPSG